ncbi:MAG: hypothetical protein QOD67_2667 [Caballeronia sp.]|nr:hypothetical protein [Caballeronia sp.]
MRILMTVRGRVKEPGRIVRRIGGEPGLFVVGVMEVSMVQISLHLLTAGPRSTAELAAELLSEGLGSKVFLEHRPPDAGINKLFPLSHEGRKGQ